MDTPQYMVPVQQTIYQVEFGYIDPVTDKMHRYTIVAETTHGETADAICSRVSVATALKKAQDEMRTGKQSKEIRKHLGFRVAKRLTFADKYIG